MAHTPSDLNPNPPPITSYHIVTRQPPAACVFQKLPEVCSPFGLNRSPPFQFIQRLRNFEPDIHDILLLSSTASEDVGVLTRAKAPLSPEALAEKITNVFTTTTMANDSRRAQIPMAEDMLTANSPIGMALDLSSKTGVPRPLPGEELELSRTPLPALMVLNNEGVLMTWWIVYANSVRQGTAYPGLVAVAAQPTLQQAQQLSSQSPSPVTPVPPKTPSFGQSAFGAPSPFGVLGGTAGTPSASIIGATSQPAAAIGALGPTFGQPSWGVRNTAQPAFGSSTPLAGASTRGVAFGAAGAMGTRASIWGATPAAPSTKANGTVGQGALSGQTPAPFGSSSSGAFGSNLPAPSAGGLGGGFASFAGNSGFSQLKPPSNGPSVLGGKPQTEGIFSKSTAGSVFANPLTENAFGKAQAGNVFGNPQTEGASDKPAPATLFGSDMSVNSSFDEIARNQPTAPGVFDSGKEVVTALKIDEPSQATSKPVERSFFGNDFRTTLGEVNKAPSTPQIKEEDMESDKDKDNGITTSPDAPIGRETTTPADTSPPSTFFSAPPLTGNFFGTQAQSRATLAAVGQSAPALSAFRMPSSAETPKAKSPIIKPEPDDTPTGVDRKIPAAPLPPDSRSKTSFTPGGSSASSTATSRSVVDDAPLPPDFIKAKPMPAPVSQNTPSRPDPTNPKNKPETVDAQVDQGPPTHLNPIETNTIDNAPPEQLELPTDEDADGIDDEGSGVDVAQEISPTDPALSFKTTPESSFGAEKSPPGGGFTTVSTEQGQPAKVLFGEIGKSSAPIFLPPKIQQSPRSPSPVRNALPGNVLRPDNARSVSAPGHAFKSSAVQKKFGSVRGSQPKTPSKPAIPSETPRAQERDRLARERRQQDEEEKETDWSDREDERIREELAADVQPTTTLTPFLAHRDYVGNLDSKPGIPGQIEKVYRDINSMVDTLGVNARSLEAFTRGHTELCAPGRRVRDDVEEPQKWCLAEVTDLMAVVGSLADDTLEDVRLHGVTDKVQVCRELQKELGTNRARNGEIKRVIDTQTDPDHIEVLRAAPLNAEPAALRHGLRRDFTNVQRLLAEAEDGVTVLKAKLVSRDAGRGNGGGGVRGVPTVEAVERTILKMTDMVEKKSGDIDVLEMHMRKLGVGRSGTSSRDGSPAVTPLMSGRTSMTGLGRNGSRSTRTTMMDQSRGRGFGKSMAESIGVGEVGRKRVSVRTVVDKAVAKEKAVRMGRARGALKGALGSGGVRVRVWDG